MAPEPDPIFGDSRLARIYDDVDHDRSDLDHYVAIVDELGADRVLDVGCGTGTFACRLARAGVAVVGIDPAGASLDVARKKPGADRVMWIRCDATSLRHAVPSTGLWPMNLASMTGNVAQVFVTDADWAATLDGIGSALGDGGHLVFETRDPAKRAWEGWDSGDVTRIVATTHGEVETWTSLLAVSEPLVSFRHHYRFVGSHETIVSDSTLRFRTLPEIHASLAAAGFIVDEVRDAPDRPGLEFVVIARKSSGVTSSTA